MPTSPMGCVTTITSGRRFLFCQHKTTSELAKVHRTGTLLEIVFYADPKVRIFAGAFYFDIQDAVDEFENPLKPQTGRATFGISSGGSRWSHFMSESLHRTQKTGRKISLLRGCGKLAVMTRWDRWEIVDVMNAAGRARENATSKCILRHVKNLGGGSYEARVGIEKTDIRTAQAMALALRNDVILMDSEGRRLRMGKIGRIVDQAQPDCTMEFQRGAAGEPFRMIWTTPIEVEEVWIPVEFRGLDLP